jgi:Ca2+-binding EF-hand superfamily protein
VHKIIKDAENLLLNMPNIRVCNLNDENEPGCIIVGDLHGSFNDLYYIIDRFDIPGKEFKFIFNGDYVDRGEKQIEVLIILLYSFIQRPDRIFLNRGNHENMSTNTDPNFDPNFMTDLRTKYGKYAPALFDSAINLFSHLQLATVVKNLVHTNLFVVHGGISNNIDLDYIQKNVKRHDFYKISYAQKLNDEKLEQLKQIVDLLWSDPIRVINGVVKPKGILSEHGCYFNKSRNIGCVFGADLTKKFCTKYAFSYLVRSHQVRNKGYGEDHDKCLTVFSNSHYCGGSNYGAIFKLEPKSLKLKPYKYKNLPDNKTERVVRKNLFLIKKFLNLIRSNQEALTKKFTKVDRTENGFIDANTWAIILSDHFDNQITPKQLIHIKDLLCECETSLNLVNYKTLFTTKLNASKLSKNMVKVLENLFQLIDRNDDNLISFGDIREALRRINNTIGAEYIIDDHTLNEVLSKLDKNGDNKIDFEDFKKAYLEDQTEVSQTS